MTTLAVVGFTTASNIGDQILTDTCRYILKTVVPENIQIKTVNFLEYLHPKKDAWKHIHSYYHLSFILLSYIVEKIFGCNALSIELRRVGWKLLLNKYYSKELKDIGGIIFAGGEWKYKNQGVNYGYELLIKTAEKYSIPLMFNAMSISEFDETDSRCLSLKTEMNRKCVKIITARDRVKLLEDYREKNNDFLIVAPVGDPALWIPECYAANITSKKTDVVGINLIRSDIFTSYGFFQMTENDLINLYVSIIKGLNNKGIKWLLFSNGVEKDHAIGAEILNRLEINDKTKILPCPTTPIELINNIHRFNAIFGARMHACITAYSLGIPVTGIVWNEKLLHFGRAIGKESSFFVGEKINAEAIVSSIVQSIGTNYDTNIREALKQSTKNYIKEFVYSEVLE